MAERANVYPLRREPKPEPRPQLPLPAEPLWREALGQRLRADDLINEPVIPSLGGRVPVVMQRIVEDTLDGLAGVFRDEAEHGIHRVPQIIGLDLDVDRAAPDTG
jgi:hypothetical protein